MDNTTDPPLTNYAISPSNRRHHSYSPFRRGRCRKHRGSLSQLFSPRKQVDVSSPVEAPTSLCHPNTASASINEADATIPSDPDHPQNSAHDHPQWTDRSSISFCSTEDLLAFPKVQTDPASRDPPLDIPLNSAERKRWRQRLKYASTFEDPLPPLPLNLLSAGSTLSKHQSPRGSSLALVKIVLPSTHSDTESPDHGGRRQTTLSTGDLRSRGTPFSDTIDHRASRRAYGATTPTPTIHYQQRSGLSGLLKLGSKIHFRRGGKSLTRLKRAQNQTSVLGVGFSHTLGHHTLGHPVIPLSPMRRCRGIRHHKPTHVTPPSSTSKGTSPDSDVVIDHDMRNEDRLLIREAEHSASGEPSPTSSPFSRRQPPDSTMLGESAVLHSELVPVPESPQVGPESDAPPECSRTTTPLAVPLLSGMDIVFHHNRLGDSPKERRQRTSSDVTDFRPSPSAEQRIEMISKKSRYIEDDHTNDDYERWAPETRGGRTHAKSDGWDTIIGGMNTPFHGHEDSASIRRSFEHQASQDSSSPINEDEPGLQRGFSVRLASLLHRGFSTSVWLCRSHDNQSEGSSRSDHGSGSPLAGAPELTQRSETMMSAFQRELDGVNNLCHDDQSVQSNESNIGRMVLSLNEAVGVNENLMRDVSVDDLRTLGSGGRVEDIAHDTDDERTMCCDITSETELNQDGHGLDRRRKSSTIPGDTTSSSISQETSMLLRSRPNDASDICLVQKSTMDEITQQNMVGRSKEKHRPVDAVANTSPTEVGILSGHDHAIDDHIQSSSMDLILPSSPSGSPPSDTAIVMKVVHKVKCSDEELQRLTREVEFLSRLNHPHILSLLSFVDSATEQWMFFEHAPLGDLYHSTVFKTLTESDTCWLIFQIVLAIHSLHTKHFIIHSDVKPHNILLFEEPDLYRSYVLQTSSVASTRQSTLDTDELDHEKKDKQEAEGTSLLSSGVRQWTNIRLKLCDFGLAQQPIPHHQPIEFDGLRGTHGYFAPELLLRHSYDYKVDMWAVGIIAFTLIGGYEPFFPVFACTKEDVEFDPRYWSEISMDCKDFIRGLLQRSPTKRLSSTDALNHDWIRSRFNIPLSLYNHE